MSRLTLGVVFALAVFVGAGWADEEKVPLDKLPAKVLDAVKTKFPKADLVSASKEKENNETIYEVSIKDDGHKIDVSLKAAQLLGFHGNGVANVRVEYVGPAPLEGSDDRRLIATLREGAPAPAPSGVMVASARPFLPRGVQAPMPPERPFDLGLSNGEGREAALQPQRAQVAAAPLPGVAYADARPQRLTAPATISGPAAASVTAVGYAPSGWSVGPQAVTSGRGLY